MQSQRFFEYEKDLYYNFDGSLRIEYAGGDRVYVTITSDKNLSCYGARVYFEENPDSINDEAGIEDVQSSNRQSSIRKFVKDGQLYILRENKTYTIIGTQL